MKARYIVVTFVVLLTMLMAAVSPRLPLLPRRENNPLAKQAMRGCADHGTPALNLPQARQSKLAWAPR